MAGMVQDQNLEKQFEKQIGCMAGFFQLFDRHQLITGKKAYSTKRLPPSKVIDQGSENSAASSPAISRELSIPRALKHPATLKPEQSQIASMPELRSPELLPPKSPLPLPIFELKEGTRSSWKFCKEAPRLSLDSRATVDAKGSLHPREIRTSSAILSANAAGDGDDKQRRSPSVIARLMGLERLPDSKPDPEPAKKVELRRSASESRVSRDLFQYRCIDGNSNINFFQVKQPNQQQHSVSQNANAVAIGNKCPYSKAARPVDHNINWYSTFPSKNANAMSQQPKALNRGGMVPPPWKAPPHRKSFFDAADVFPEPKQAATVSVCGDIERKLKMRGIDEPSKDLETLKQILEALQLKGLLHSNRRFEQRNLVYDRSFQSEDSPRMGDDSPASRYGVRRNSNLTSSGEYSPTVSPRREGQSSDRNRSLRSPTRVRSESNARRSNNSIVKPKTLNVETQRRAAVANESTEKRRACGVEAPKVSSRRNGCSPDHQTVMNRLPRNRRSTGEMYHKEKITTVVTEDESSSISESTFSTSSQTDTEQRWKAEECRGGGGGGGKSLLERCDKLLHSIAEMNAAADMQPSPVSVLDSSSSLFYKDESFSSSPSPVMKRSIDFKEDGSSEVDEETWGSIFVPVESKLEAAPEDSDLVYISQVLMASHCLPEDCDIFLLLEKQQYLKGKDISKVSRLQRRLIFDIIAEILERNTHLPPWKAFSWSDSQTVKSSVRKIWSEFRRIRERDTAEDLFEIICGALKKDLAGDAINGWGECPVELSEAVLDIERLIFKDLIGETIRDLAAFGCKSTGSVTPRRKLVF